MKLELLKAGHCYHPERVTIKGGSWKPKEFPAIVSLLKHPSKGYMLFDTGYSKHFTEATNPFPERFYRWLTPICLDDSEHLVAQLQTRNIAVDDIRYIFISHFHADHIAGLKDFPQSQFVCSKIALEKILQGSRLSNLIHGHLSNLLPSDFSNRAVFIENCEKVQIPSSLQPFQYGYDLFNDGALFAIALPGHDHGHYGLMVYQDNKSSFLIGDACWSIRAITEHRHAHPISHIILSDTKKYYETLSKLSLLHNRNVELELLPSHCNLTYETYCAKEN